MDRGRAEGGMHLSGVLEALIAATIAALLLPAVTAAWRHWFHGEPPPWATGALPNLVAFVILLSTVWFATRLLRRWVTRRKRKTPLAKGDRLSIYVARFGDDPISETARTSVMDSIRNVIGRERVEVLPAGIQLSLTEGVSLDDVPVEATHRARALLAKKHGDLLIWGRVHTVPGQRPVIELWFVSAGQPGAEGQRFGLTEKFTLEAGFGPEMGAALAAVAAALSLPATQDAGKYVAGTLRPVVGRLAPLVHSVPQSMRGDDRGRLFFSYGLIQYVIGEQSGESPSLERAVAAYREALKEWTRERVPLDWAATQNNLGNALARLGERESGVDRLEQAVEAYREALKERIRERVPLLWATTQNNLGNALASSGERKAQTRPLEQAVAAYSRALTEWTRERAPLEWATAQNNLGNALRILGEQESGVERLKQAVAVYSEALKEWTRERVPLKWAMTQNNLGTALQILGSRESGTGRLEQAAAAHDEALTELTRERVPLLWATTKNNVGAALARLGTRESRMDRVEQAIDAFREALTERTRDRVPIDFATTQINLGNALTKLGELESGSERLEEAVEVYQKALEVLTGDVAPHLQSRARAGLAKATKLLEARKSNPG